MTKFDPAIAYRILHARRENYYRESVRADYERILKRVNGTIYAGESQELADKSRTLMEAANRLNDVLDYLRDRMREEEETHD